MIPWSRPDPAGAWVRFDDATLALVDPTLAERLGVAHSQPCSAPLELHIAVTLRCHAPCRTCYTDARDDGDVPDLEILAARLAEARRAGVSTVAFGGGEPLVRDDLCRLAEAAREHGLVPVLTTSGIGLNEARALELRAFAQVNVSHDGAADGYELVRGFDGSGHAERAIAMLHTAGIAVGVNVVLTRSSFARLDATADRIASLGASEIQLLRLKPAGRARSMDYLAERLSPADVDALWPAVVRLIERRDLRVRIDCAMVPLLSSGLARVPSASATLAALGVFGCEAAHHLGAMRTDGSTAPCSFFSLSRDVGEATLRAHHASLPAPCSTCELAPVCRGGCQVVSIHARGSVSPDPECPRVIAHAQQP